MEMVGHMQRKRHGEVECNFASANPCYDSEYFIPMNRARKISIRCSLVDRGPPETLVFTVFQAQKKTSVDVLDVEVVGRGDLN